MLNLQRATSSFVLLLSSSPLAGAGVLTVGASGSTYTEIATAVAAAVDGDLILVKGGSYDGFAIDGKSISVVADAGSTVSIYALVAVRNLTATQTVVLSGMAIDQTFGGSALTLANNAGHVRLEAVTAKAAQYPFAVNWFALDVAGCADVALVGCSFEGRAGQNAGLGLGNSAEPAIWISSSTVAIFETSALGGTGRPGYVSSGGFPQGGGAGAPGLWASNAHLFARGCTLKGGTGGPGLNSGVPPPQCTTPYQFPTHGGSGGPGTRVDGAASSAILADTLSSGGAGGPGGVDPCGNHAGNGSTGPSLSDPLGIVVVQSGPAIALLVTSPAREAQSLALRFVGPPGYGVVLAFGAGPAAIPAPALGGVLLLQAPLRRRALGTIPPSGILDAQLPVAELGSGIESKLLYSQAAFISTAGQTILASPAVLKLLDQAF